MADNINLSADYDSDYIEMDIDDLVDCLTDNVKDDIKDFNDVVNMDSYLNREIVLGDIVDGTGTAISGYIDFWNRWDDRHNIPVEERKPIHLIISSYGGNLVDTYQIIDSIKLSKTPVYTIAAGASYSGGFFTFIAGHKRFAYTHASFLFHEGATGTSGSSSQFENYAKFYRVQLNQLRDLVYEYTNIDEVWYKEHQKEDVWFTAEEAMELGIADVIVTDRRQLEGDN